MKKFLLLLLILLVLAAIPAKAQNTTASSTETAPINQGAFSLTASAVALPGGGQTVAGTILGQTFAVTDTLSLRATELIAPGSSTNAYFGGVQWFPNVQKVLSKTRLTSYGLVPYLTASAGADQVSPAGSSTKEHYAFLLGGGLNYCPMAAMCVNAFEVQYARLPGLANNTAIVSSGLTLTFGK